MTYLCRHSSNKSLVVRLSVCTFVGGVFSKYRRAGEAEHLHQRRRMILCGYVSLAKLTAVAFVKNKYHALDPATFYHLVGVAVLAESPYSASARW